ncbi:hypothetical protein BS78_03G355000 [Paspalum vaginatum]|nr:hypothetical protein BS78_03G355000 [Paspalum vaginatum]
MQLCDASPWYNSLPRARAAGPTCSDAAAARAENPSRGAHRLLLRDSNWFPPLVMVDSSRTLLLCPPLRLPLPHPCPSLPLSREREHGQQLHARTPSPCSPRLIGSQEAAAPIGARRAARIRRGGRR